MRLLNQGSTFAAASQILVLDYEALYEKYHSEMIEKLRNFNGGEDGLQYWVPVPNIEESLAGLFASLLETGHSRVKVLLWAETAARVNRSRLAELLSRDGAGVEEQLDQNRTALIIGLSGHARHASGAALADMERRRAAARVAERKEVAGYASGAGNLPVEPDRIDVRYMPTLGMFAGAIRREQREGEKIRAEGVLGPVTLMLEVEAGGHCVLAAAHTGTSTQTARLLLDAFCHFVTNMPVQELADHGVVRFEAQLRGRDAPSPLPGINHPRAIDPSFRWLECLVRAAAAAWRRQTAHTGQLNEYDLPLGAAWAMLPQAERLERLNRIISAALQETSAPADSAKAVAFEHEVRVVIQFSGDVPGGQKARILMMLERDIKDHADPRLEVHQHERRDDSALRRLKQGEDK